MISFQICVGLPEIEHSAQTTGEIHEDLIISCEMQCERPAYFKVVDNTNELAVQFMYLNVFCMAFPMTPILFIANNVMEFNADLIRLFDRRRPIPVAADGLADAWGTVFHGIIYLSVPLNLGWCAYHTRLTYLVTGVNTLLARMMFFTFGTAGVVLVLVIIQLCIQDKPNDVEDHLARQRKVELRMVSRVSTLEHAQKILSQKQKILELSKLQDQRIQAISNEIIVDA